MTILVVGGTSGLGLEMCRELAGQGHSVITTGLNDPKQDKVVYREFDLTQLSLPERVDEFVKQLSSVDGLYYVAGLYPAGKITDLSPKQIEGTLSVGGRGLIYFVRALLNKQGQLAELVTISSTAQWEPHKDEVLYNFVKAGEGQFSNGLAEDGRISKVLVVAPTGMKNHDEPADDPRLDKIWVARQILQALKGNFRFKFIKILRGPARVEEAEKR